MYTVETIRGIWVPYKKNSTKGAVIIIDQLSHIEDIKDTNDVGCIVIMKNGDEIVFGLSAFVVMEMLFKTEPT